MFGILTVRSAGAGRDAQRSGWDMGSELDAAGTSPDSNTMPDAARLARECRADAKELLDLRDRLVATHDRLRQRLLMLANALAGGQPSGVGQSVEVVDLCRQSLVGTLLGGRPPDRDDTVGTVLAILKRLEASLNGGAVATGANAAEGDLLPALGAARLPDDGGRRPDDSQPPYRPPSQEEIFQRVQADPDGAKFYALMKDVQVWKKKHANDWSDATNEITELSHIWNVFCKAVGDEPHAADLGGLLEPHVGRLQDCLLRLDRLLPDPPFDPPQSPGDQRPDLRAAVVKIRDKLLALLNQFRCYIPLDVRAGQSMTSKRDWIETHYVSHTQPKLVIVRVLQRGYQLKRPNREDDILRAVVQVSNGQRPAS